MAKLKFILLCIFQVDENFEGGEFCLQFCSGRVISNESSNVSFHQAYMGPNTSHLVKHLRAATVYSFRVCSRPDSESDWCIWSVPRQAVTNIPHYREFFIELIINIYFIFVSPSFGKNFLNCSVFTNTQI